MRSVCVITSSRADFGLLRPLLLCLADNPRLRLSILATGTHLLPPRVAEIHAILQAHLEDLYAFYGIETGVRVARKHISWYTKGLVGSAAFRHHMNQLPDIAQQRQAVNDFFFGLAEKHEHLEYSDNEQNENNEGIAA